MKPKTKKCPCCKKTLAFTLEFYGRDYNTKYGLRCYCLQCNRKITAKHYAAGRKTFSQERQANKEVYGSTVHVSRMLAHKRTVTSGERPAHFKTFSQERQAGGVDSDTLSEALK